MTGFKQLLPVVGFASLLYTGCYSGAESIDAVDEISDMRSIHGNSLKYNDLRWNNLKWNDIKWNGIRWNGDQWTDSRLDGSSIEVSRKVGWKWERHSGEELIGMEIDISVDSRDADDQPAVADFVIRVDDIYTDE